MPDQLGTAEYAAAICSRLSGQRQPASDGFNRIGHCDLRYSAALFIRLLGHQHAESCKKQLLAKSDSAQPGHGEFIEQSHAWCQV